MRYDVRFELAWLEGEWWVWDCETREHYGGYKSRAEAGHLMVELQSILAEADERMRLLLREARER